MRLFDHFCPRSAAAWPLFDCCRCDAAADQRRAGRPSSAAQPPPVARRARAPLPVSLKTKRNRHVHIRSKHGCTCGRRGADHAMDAHSACGAQIPPAPSTPIPPLFSGDGAYITTRPSYFLCEAGRWGKRGKNRPSSVGDGVVTRRAKHQPKFGEHKSRMSVYYIYINILCILYIYIYNIKNTNQHLRSPIQYVYILN